MFIRSATWRSSHVLQRRCHLRRHTMQGPVKKKGKPRAVDLWKLVEEGGIKPQYARIARFRLPGSGRRTPSQMLSAQCRERSTGRRLSCCVLTTTLDAPGTSRWRSARSLEDFSAGPQGEGLFVCCDRCIQWLAERPDGQSRRNAQHAEHAEEGLAWHLLPESTQEA